jgi:hypothetical protein
MEEQKWVAPIFLSNIPSRDAGADDDEGAAADVEVADDDVGGL